MSAPAHFRLSPLLTRQVLDLNLVVLQTHYLKYRFYPFSIPPLVPPATGHHSLIHIEILIFPGFYTTDEHVRGPAAGDPERGAVLRQ